MKNDAQKICFIQLFTPILKNSENLNHDLALCTLNFVDIYCLKGEFTQPMKSLLPNME